MNCVFEVRLTHLYLPRVYKYVLFLKGKQKQKAPWGEYPQVSLPYVSDRI